MGEAAAREFANASAKVVAVDRNQALARQLPTAISAEVQIWEC